jgi:SagB-type dehydrogenase family enzyme
MPRRPPADLARLYHLNSSNSRPILPDLSLNYDRRPQRYRTYPGARRIALPGRDHQYAMPVGEAIQKRCSGRDFSTEELPLAQLGRLLYNGYGVTGTVEIEGEHISRRPVPSGGALYPLELYVATQNVEGLEDAIYHYDARDHELEWRRSGLFHQQLAKMTLGQDMLGAANVAILIATVTERTMWKYGQRGYRYVLLEAGHVGQNLYLAATASDLGIVGIGGFFDAEVNQLCMLPKDEEVIYMLCAGIKAGR